MKRNYPFDNVATNKTDQRWVLLNTHKSPTRLPQTLKSRREHKNKYQFPLALMGALAPGSVYLRPRQTSVTVGQIAEQRVKKL